MSNVTERADAIAFNWKGEEGTDNDRQDRIMLSAIIVALVIIAALGYAVRSRRSGDQIVRRPYNNRYNAASGAREDHFGDGLL